MLALHFAMALLATGRITEIITQDRIMERVRQRWPSYLWTCARCVSVWAGIFATVAFYALPYLNWPFALSYAYFILAEIMSYVNNLQKRGIRIEPQASGLVNVDWAGHDPRQAVNILKGIVASVEQMKAANGGPVH